MHCPYCGSKIGPEGEKMPVKANDGFGGININVNVCSSEKNCSSAHNADVLQPESVEQADIKADADQENGQEKIPERGKVAKFFTMIFFFLFGFFLPYSGPVLFLVWDDDHAAESKAAAIGSIVAFMAILVFAYMESRIPSYYSFQVPYAVIK